MTTKVTKTQDNTTLWIQYSPSDINIVLITRSGMITGVNYWMGVEVDNEILTRYSHSDERLTRYVMPRVFARFDTECILPYPDFDDMVEFIDNLIWDYRERDNDTIALNSIGHWLYGSAMYPMYKSDNGLIMPCNYNDDERIHLDEITHWAFDQLSTHDWETICEQATQSVAHRVEHLIFVGRVKPVESKSSADDVTITIPREQLEIIREALVEHLTTMSRILKYPTELQQYQMFDLHQLESLMKYDVKVTLTAKQASDFCGDNGVDLPIYE